MSFNPTKNHELYIDGSSLVDKLAGLRLHPKGEAVDKAADLCRQQRNDAADLNRLVKSAEIHNKLFVDDTANRLVKHRKVQLANNIRRQQQEAQLEQDAIDRAAKERADADAKDRADKLKRNTQLRLSQIDGCNDTLVVVDDEFRCILSLARLTQGVKRLSEEAGVPHVGSHATTTIEHAWAAMFNQWKAAYSNARKKDATTWKVSDFASFIASFGVMMSSVESLIAAHFADGTQDDKSVKTVDTLYNRVPAMIPLLLIDTLNGKGTFTDHQFVDDEEMDESFLAGDVTRRDAVITNLTRDIVGVDGKADTQTVSSVVCEFIKLLE